MTEQQIKITHYSVDSDNDRRDVAEDLRFVFDQEPDVATFTNMKFGSPAARAMMSIARDREYRPVVNPGRVQMAVNVKRAGLHVKTAKITPVYGDTHVVTAHLSFFGSDLYITSCKWDAKPKQEIGRFVRTTKTLAETVRRYARGNNLSLFSGEMTADPDWKVYPRGIFSANDLITIWEDAEVQPRTSGKFTFDMIGRTAVDNRIVFNRYKVHAYGNSDHRPITAFYDIDVAKTKKAKDKKKNEKDDPVEFFNPSGVVSFEDYTDDEIFALPVATDFEDTENG